MTTANDATGGEDAAALMARLSSQFGDLDLESLNASLLHGRNSINGNKDDDDSGVDDDAPSEDSSLAEPTPEELAAWQAQQFQKGKEIIQKQKEESMDPIQKRRLALRDNSRNYKESSDDQGDDEWEEIAAFPDLQGQSSIFFGCEESTTNSNDNFEDGVVVGLSPLLRTLATSPDGDPELLGTAWYRLYSSVDGDGLSFFSLCHEICSYDGPTLILLNVVPSKSRMVVNHSSEKSVGTACIGFFTTSTWQESPEYHGKYSDHDTAFLFTMNQEQNSVQFFNMQEPSKLHGPRRGGYMYCHPSTKSTKRRGGNNYRSDASAKGRHMLEMTDGAVHGIGIGGKPSQPRLHLTESLEECRCLTYDSDRSFQDGNLFLDNSAFEDSLYYFDVESIEVWGVGGKSWIQEALEAREKARGIAASTLEQRRRVYDKSQLLDDFRNGVYSTTTKSATSGSYFDQIVYASELCDV